MRCVRWRYPTPSMHTDPAEARRIVLRHPDLRRYLSARFIVGMATQVQTVAVGWQVFSVSGDPFDLGLVALSQFLPFIVLILPAGHVADRYDRRRVQLVTYSLSAAATWSSTFREAYQAPEPPGESALESPDDR